MAMLPEHQATMLGLDHIVGIKAVDLTLGAEYQRDLIETHAERIAEDFDVRKALVIVVSIRPTGERYVVDGQHRVVAALRSDPEQILPCIVYHGLSVAEEAELFSRLQRDRVPLNAQSMFWADVISGQPEAVAVKRMVEASGYFLSRTPGAHGAVTCYSALRVAYRSRDGHVLDQTLAAIRAAWGTSEPPTAVSIKAISAFINQYFNEFDTQRLVDVLSRTTQRGFEVKSRQFKEAVGTGYAGASHGGRYVQAIYNKGLRRRQLPEWVPGKGERGNDGRGRRTGGN